MTTADGLMIHRITSLFKHELGRANVRGFSVRGMAIIAGLTSSVVLANVLGPEKYGTYSFAFAVITIIALPVQMGLPTLVVRETARADASQDWALLRGIWAWANRIVVTSSLVAVLLTLLGLAFFADLISEVRREALLWGLPLIPLLAYGNIRAASLRGLKRVFEGGFPDKVLRPLLLAGFVGGAALIVGREEVPASLVLGLNSLAAFFAFLLGAWLLLRARPVEMRASREKRVEGTQWRKAIIPLSLIAGMQIVTQNAGLLLLGILATDYDVGQYRVAATIMTLGTFGLMSSYLVAQPYLVAAHHRGDKAQLQSTVSQVAAMALAASFVVVLVVWLFGNPIIRFLYGADFRDAYLPLCVLMGGVLVHATFGMGGGVLTMTGHERLVLKVATISAALHLAGNLILIPYFGVMGTAMATSVSLSVSELAKYVIARRRLDVDGSAFSWILRSRRERAS